MGDNYEFVCIGNNCTETAAVCIDENTLYTAGSGESVAFCGCGPSIAELSYFETMNGPAIVVDCEGCIPFSQQLQVCFAPR
jgi:hypothetical protein